MTGPRFRLAVAAVVLVAAALRLPALDRLPPGLQFDEAHNAVDAARILDGARPVFLPDNGGREPVNVYLMAPFLAILGREHAALAVRLPSALVGILAVAVVAVAVAAVTRDRRLGALAAGFLAVMYPHLHFSRFGIRAILAPLLSAAAVWAWWRAVGPVGGRRGPGWAPAVACGALLGAAAWSHPSGRLLPLVLLGHAAWRWTTDRGSRAATVRSLALAGVAAALIFAPLGAYFARHPGAFTSHPSDVSLAAVAAADHGGSVPAALAANLAAVAGMLFVAGDPSAFHNLPGLPALDPLGGLLAVLGIGAAAAALTGPDRRARDRAILFACWLAVGLAPTILSDRAPNYSRAMAALPVVALLPALGLRWLGARLEARGSTARLDARAATALAAVALALAAAWTARAYFHLFPSTPGLYYSYDVDKLDAFRALAAVTDARVLLHPLWADQATIAFLDAEDRLESFDGHDSVVVTPGGTESLVAMPAKEAEREEWYDDAKRAYGEVAVRRRITDAMGAELLRTLRLPRLAVGDMRPPRDAALEPQTFVQRVLGGAVELVGYTAGPARPGEPVGLVLVWRCIARPDRDLTTFVHLVAADGRTVGQDDRETAHGSYRTTRWRPGEVIVDRFQPVLDPSWHRGGDRGLSARVGLYDLATGERLRAEDGADAVVIGPLEVQ